MGSRSSEAWPVLPPHKLSKAKLKRNIESTQITEESDRVEGKV
jgi:hypothetical protein